MISFTSIFTFSNQCFRIFGVFDFSVRQFHIRDPEMIKQVTIKDFDYFQDHRVFIDESMDEVMSKALIMMCGEDWRAMRATYVVFKLF